MTVILVGVGADTEHVRPALELTSDGHFDYIPIPESYPTNEGETFGTWDLSHRGGTAADYVEAIRPKGENGEWDRDPEAIATHPVHHDPNFEAMTFGDRRGGGGKGATLVNNLKPNDILGFYTGMREGPNDDNLNRYLYGYMTVNEVRDLSVLEGEEYHDGLREFPENAHTKRLEGAGAPKHEDVVIIDGKEPTTKLDDPVKVGERIEKRPWYQVTEKFASQFAVRGGQKGIGRKFPLLLDLTDDEFLAEIKKHTSN